MTSSMLVASSSRNAAAYVRMSTERQQYSVEIQAAALEDYAAKRDILIVKRYSDEGRSGLTLDGREGLKSLLSDVQSGQVEFDLLLVYDVSRWGRFQDADESAYYEFLCKKCGVEVIYCAELFSNDGSLTATIIKNIKRIMAAEYSRELSKKTFQGQCRLVERGCHVGAPAGYGLRRLLIDKDGIAKFVLEPGQYKGLQTDRVVLIPGPPEELATIDRIYRLFLEDRMSICGIARLLNKEGLLTDLRRPWTRGVVRDVLTKEKYVGNNIYNRTSKKLKGRMVKNPDHLWVRADGAFQPVVDAERFDRARARLKRARYDAEAMISELVRLKERCGEVNERTINAQPEMAKAETYRARFGSLGRAYDLAGIRKRLSDQEMIQNLITLNAQFGKVSERILRRERGVSCGPAYRRRFGSLINACRIAGVTRSDLSNERMLEDLVKLHSRFGRQSEREFNQHEGVAWTSTYRKRFGGLAKAYDIAGLA